MKKDVDYDILNRVVGVPVEAGRWEKAQLATCGGIKMIIEQIYKPEIKEKAVCR